MAKSIRSKWRRKCRAVKRIRYGEKELDRLKKTLANDPLNSKTEGLMKDIEVVANVKTAEEIETMELEGVAKEFNPKTLRDKNGAFPVWLHPRKIKAGKKKNKKKKGKKNVKRNN